MSTNTKIIPYARKTLNHTEIIWYSWSVATILHFCSCAWFWKMFHLFGIWNWIWWWFAVDWIGIWCYFAVLWDDGIQVQSRQQLISIVITEIFKWLQHSWHKCWHISGIILIIFTVHVMDYFVWISIQVQMFFMIHFHHWKVQKWQLSNPFMHPMNLDTVPNNSSLCHSICISTVSLQFWGIKIIILGNCCHRIYNK